MEQRKQQTAAALDERTFLDDIYDMDKAIDRFFEAMGRTGSTWLSYWLVAPVKRRLAYVEARWKELQPDLRTLIHGTPMPLTKHDVAQALRSFGCRETIADQADSEKSVSEVDTKATNPPPRPPSESARVLRDSLVAAIGECAQLLAEYEDTPWLIAIFSKGMYRKRMESLLQEIETTLENIVKRVDGMPTAAPRKQYQEQDVGADERSSFDDWSLEDMRQHMRAMRDLLTVLPKGEMLDARVQELVLSFEKDSEEIKRRLLHPASSA